MVAKTAPDILSASVIERGPNGHAVHLRIDGHDIELHRQNGTILLDHWTIDAPKPERVDQAEPAKACDGSCGSGGVSTGYKPHQIPGTGWRYDRTLRKLQCYQCSLRSGRVLNICGTFRLVRPIVRWWRSRMYRKAPYLKQTDVALRTLYYGCGCILAIKWLFKRASCPHGVW